MYKKNFLKTINKKKYLYFFQTKQNYKIRTLALIKWQKEKYSTSTMLQILMHSYSKVKKSVKV